MTREKAKLFRTYDESTFSYVQNWPYDGSGLLMQNPYWINHSSLPADVGTGIPYVMATAK